MKRWIGKIGLTSLWCVIVMGFASPAVAEPLGGVSACALAEGVPAKAHPLRQHPSLRAIFQALDAAGSDQKKNARVLARFEKLLRPIYRDAELVFARPRATSPDRPPRDFEPRPARVFLEKWVFAPNAPMRIGRDRIEPAPGVAAGIMLAACRAGERAEAIALGRRLSGPETTAQRAFAALLLAEDGRAEEARELVPELGDGGFVAPFVAAELSADEVERARLHALAGRHVDTPDQASAHATQGRRFAGSP
jgi:hypothetical protein